MKKKIIAFILLALYILSLCAFAVGDEDKIYVSDFKFIDGSGNENTLSSNSKIFAVCNIERTDADTKNDVPYEFVLQVRRKGKLISLTSTKGSIDVADGVVPISVEGYIEGDAAGCEVSAYLFNSVNSLIPISSSAIYGSDVAELEKITVNNKVAEDFSTDASEYTYHLEKYPLNVPVLRFFPKDLSSISYISGSFPGPMVYKLLSSDKSKEKEYKINFDIAKKEMEVTTIKHTEKRRDAAITGLKVIDPESTNVYTTSIRLIMPAKTSTTTVAESVSKLNTMSYLTFDVGEGDFVAGSRIFLTIRGKVNTGTIYEDLNISLFGYNELNDTPAFTGDNGYIGEKLGSLNILKDGTPTSNAQYFDYKFDVTEYATEKVAEGESELTFALGFDAEEMTEIWEKIKNDQFPKDKATDLIFGIVTNTAATRKHNGTGIIYGDAQPKLHYYEYEMEKNPYVNLTGDGAMVEAEDVELDSSFSLVKDTDASGGEYILSSSDKKYMEMDRYELNEYFTTNQVPLTLKLDCKDEGYYVVYMRVLSSKGKGDYYQRLNGNGDLKIINGSKDLFTEGEKYTWIPMSGYRLKEGINTIEFCYRQDIAIDKFIISKNAVDLPVGKDGETKEFTFKDTVADTSYLYAVPDIKPGNERPRLLVKASELDKVRANLTHERNVDVYNELLKTANKNYDCILDASPTGEDNSNREYLDYIEANAFLYLMDENEDNSKKAIDGLLNYLSTYDAESGGTTASRNGGYMAYISALVYDWCYDALTTEQKQEIVNSVIFNFKRTEMKWPPTQYAGFSHGEETILPYMLSFGIATYGDYSEAYNIAMGKVLEESVPTRNIRYSESNYNLEGEFYAAIRSGSDWFLYLMLENLGCESLITDNIRYQPYTYVFRNTPAGAYLRDGDGENYPLVKSSGGAIGTFLSASLFDDPYMLSEFYRFYDSGKFETGDPSINMSMFLALNRVDLEMKQRDELPLSYYTGDGAGMMTARTSWDEGAFANTMIASFKTPERYVGGHSHRDSGHFYIYYKGPLALDSGVYTGQYYYDENGDYVTNIGSGSDHNAAYAKQTIAHNAMLIYDPSEDTGDIPNNGGQYPENPAALDPSEYDNNQKGYGEVLGADFGPDLNKPEYTYLKGDITSAYNGKAEEYTRSFMFLNLFDDVYPGALIVFDNVISSDASFDKKWLLHTQEEPEINGNTVTAVNTLSLYNGKIYNETLLPKSGDLKIEKLGGEGLEYPDINGVNQMAVPKYDYNDESGKWRVEISPSVKKKQDMFLNVLTVSENDEKISMLDAEYIENDDFVGALIKNKAVFFGKEKGRFSKNVTVSVSSEAESIDFYVADLKEGSWQIFDGSTPIGEASSKDKGGVIAFKAAPGTYTLKYNGADSLQLSDFNFLNAVKALENKTKVVYNHIFDSSIEAKLVSGKAYVSLEGLINRLDNMTAVISKDADTLTAEIYKGTSYHRSISFTADSKYAGVTQLTSSNPVLQQKTMADEIIKDGNGELYVSADSIITGIFAGYADYDPVADVIRINGSARGIKD